MTTGIKYIVTYINADVSGTPTPTLQTIDFTGSFNYSGSFTATAICVRDQQQDTGHGSFDRFIVTFLYPSGGAPSSGHTMAQYLSDATSAVATAGV